MQSLLALLALPILVAAHYKLEYPTWRADSFEDPYSQWTYPCAGVNETTNRTSVPLTGIPIVLDLHHAWTYAFINLGLGKNVTSFNISLVHEKPLNFTGNGTLAFPSYQLPPGVEVKDGQDATLQVITVGDTGSALYNCADITFKADGKGLDANVKNTTGITVDEVVSASQTAGANASSTAGGAAAATSSKAAGEKLVYNGMALIAAAAAVVAVV